MSRLTPASGNNVLTLHSQARSRSLTVFAVQSEEAGGVPHRGDLAQRRRRLAE